MSKKQVDLAVKTFKETGSIKKAAKAAGAPIGDARKWAIQAGLKVPNHEQVAPWAEEAAKLWSEGMSIAKIRDKLNLTLSRSRIHQVVMREAGQGGSRRKKQG